MKYLVLILFFSSCSWFIATDQTNELLFEKSSVSKVKELEESLGASVEFYEGGVDPRFCPSEIDCSVIKAYLFTYRESDELPLMTRYYFDRDSMVQFIHYEWSIDVPNQSHAERELAMDREMDKFQKYINKLNVVAEEISKTYGKPISKDKGMQTQGLSIMPYQTYLIKFKKSTQVVEFRLMKSNRSEARFYKLLAKVYWL